MSERKLSAEQIDEACALREAGWSCARIARKFGVSPGCISWHCLKLLADPPKPRPLPPVPTAPVVARRNGHEVRRFTSEEDQRLLDMATAGARKCDMARALDRKSNSITGRLMTLARREEREMSQ